MKIALTMAACAVTAALCTPVALAGGPKGIGDLKLEMTKSEVEALSTESGTNIQILGPLQLVPPQKAFGAAQRFSPVHVTSNTYEGRVQLPQWRTPLPIKLSFKADQLVALAIDLPADRVLAQSLRDAIAAKHGEGELTDNDMTEKECAYPNGVTYKVRLGGRVEQWLEPHTEWTRVETHMWELALGSCTGTMTQARKDRDFVTLSMAIQTNPGVRPPARATRPLF